MRIKHTDTPQKVGEIITVKGWVHTRRDHGGLIFIDLRDHTGLLQIVIHPENKSVFSVAETVRDEYVLSVVGEVKLREEHLVNENIASGRIEVVAHAIEVLNKCDPLPIQPFSDQQANEELRFKYRYLDLRRPKMQEMLVKRAQLYALIRSYMDERNFIEISTPILASSSPEGARDFLIPSRLHDGKFYALPQAPQQFKQLLMVGGVPRYYQIAACFRDEDPRADRLYGEFYQLDCEMSFVEDGEEVRRTVEPLITSAVEAFGKKLMSADIPRIPYDEAMNVYGSDKPDLRYDMKLVDLSDVFATTEFAVFKNADVVKGICVKGGASFTRKQIDTFTETAKQEGAGGLAYMLYEEGGVRSPIAKFMREDELTALKTAMGAEDGDAVFFGADTRSTVNKVLGKLRSVFGDVCGLKDPNVVALAWIVDFPFYEWDEARKKVDFGHNPFSMPRGGIAALEAATTDEEKLAIVADQYDMVMNGYEICSGAVRNHNPDIMYRAFGLLGYDNAYVEEKFGAMLNAFKYGAPPHAGCAYGIDRMFMELMNEQNVREVVAFPKNGSGVDVMMNSPSSVDTAQLRELGL